MTKPAAFRATYSDLKLIKTRQCVQIVFELPLADFDAAYDVLGGMPNPANETWFGIAPIKTGKEVMPNQQPRVQQADARPQPSRPQAGAKRDWRDIPPPQQAGIRCDEPAFGAFLRETRPDDWSESRDDTAECVRLVCGVGSRAYLATSQRARVIWLQLDTEYQAWLAKERVGA